VQRDSKWIGLAKVVPLPRCDAFDPAVKGAYVTIVAWAKNAKDFDRVARNAFAEYRLELAELEDCELLDTRIHANRSSDSPHQGDAVAPLRRADAPGPGPRVMT
jgi:hypothetical protein